MPKEKISSYLVGIVLIVLIVIVVFKFQTKNTDAKVIKIGIVAPMTGPAALFGNSLWRGMEMAQADLKETKNKYEIIVEDDGTNPAQAASAASKLININKVAAIVTTTSGSGNAVSPLAKIANIPHICVCSDATIADGITNYTNSVLPDDEGEAWINEASKHGVKTIAILAQTHPGTIAIGNGVRKAAKAKGMIIVYDESFEKDTRDFKTIIAKATAEKPDIFFVEAFPPSLDIIGQELHDVGIKNVSNAGSLTLTTTPSLFEGVWFTDAKVADTNFQLRFEKEFPGVKFNVRTAPFGYDSFTMLVKGFESGKPVNDYLRTLSSYEGKVGHVTEVGLGNFKSDVGVWLMENGKAGIEK